MAQNKDTKGKGVGEEGVRLHKRLAMGEMAETGAGKGAMGGKSTGKKTPA